MFDPETDVKRLRRACKASRRDMEVSRRNYMAYLKELAGPHYSATAVTHGRPVNLVELAATIYKQNLLATVPQVNVISRDPELAADAYAFERAVNQLLDEQDVQPELELTIINAMFSPFGVLKVSLDAANAAEIDGVSIPTGAPLMQAVMFDDLVVDMTARSVKDIAFIGNRYSMTVEAAIAAGFPQDSVIALWRQYTDTNLDQDDPQRLSRKDKNPKDENLKDLIEVWDVWLPEEGLVVTLGGEDFEGTGALKILEWTGPKRGPFHLLWFEPIPGNALPNPPVGLWIDLHELINTLWNKLSDQAERQKSITAFGSGDKQDGETVRDAGDGDVVTLNNLSGVAKLDMGGINQQNLLFADAARQRFNDQAGNVFLFGGLQPATGTVGQDKLLSEGASQRLQMMQARVYDFIRRVLRDYGEYIATDPLLEVPITKEVPETDITIPGTWSQDQMRGDYYHYILDIQPHSMQQKSPEERLARAQDMWRQDVVPMIQVLMAEGKLPNFEAYYKLIADLTNQPELGTLITYTQGEMLPSMSGGVKPPSTTTRNYNTGGGGGGGGMGGGMDMASQMAAAGRDNNNQTGMLRPVQ